MAVHVEVPVPHRYEYVPQKARKPVTAWISGSLPYALPEIDGDRAPVAVTMVRVREPFPHFNPDPRTVPDAWVELDGRLARMAAATDGSPLGPEVLSATNARGYHAAWHFAGNPYVVEPPGPTLNDDPASLLPRRVVSNGRAAAEAHALDALSRSAVVDGTLVCPGPEPVWVVRERHEQGYLVMACLERDLDAPSVRHYVHVPFRGDRLDAAVAYAEARLAADAEQGMPPGRVFVAGSIDVARPGLLRFDATERVVRVIAERAESYANIRGFAGAPVPVLAAWLGYRAARGRMGTGTEGAALDALDALARLREALPEPIPAPGPREDAGPLYLLRMHLSGLDAVAAALRSDAEARAAPPGEDLESIAALGPR